MPLNLLKPWQNQEEPLNLEQIPLLLKQLEKSRSFKSKLGNFCEHVIGYAGKSFVFFDNKRIPFHDVEQRFDVLKKVIRIQMAVLQSLSQLAKRYRHINLQNQLPNSELRLIISIYLRSRAFPNNSSDIKFKQLMRNSLAPELIPDEIRKLDAIELLNLQLIAVSSMKYRNVKKLSLLIREEELLWESLIQQLGGQQNMAALLSQPNIPQQAKAVILPFLSIANNPLVRIAACVLLAFEITLGVFGGAMVGIARAEASLEEQEQSEKKKNQEKATLPADKIQPPRPEKKPQSFSDDDYRRVGLEKQYSIKLFREKNISPDDVRKFFSMGFNEKDIYYTTDSYNPSITSFSAWLEYLKLFESLDVIDPKQKYNHRFNAEFEANECIQWGISPQVMSQGISYFHGMPFPLREKLTIILYWVRDKYPLELLRDYLKILKNYPIDTYSAYTDLHACAESKVSPEEMDSYLKAMKDDTKTTLKLKLQQIDFMISLRITPKVVKKYLSLHNQGEIDLGSYPCLKITGYFIQDMTPDVWININKLKNSPIPSLMENTLHLSHEGENLIFSESEFELGLRWYAKYFKEKDWDKVLKLITQAKDKLGISHFYRFTPHSLEMLLKQSRVGKPIALLIFPNNDPQKSFARQGARDIHESIIERYHTTVVEVSSDDEMYQAIESVGKNRGKISFFAISGHGEKTKTLFGKELKKDTPEQVYLDIGDFQEIVDKDLKQYLHEDCIIWSDSCSTGKDGMITGNLAEMLHRAFERTVFASKTGFAGMDVTLTFDRSGKVTSIMIKNKDNTVVFTAKPSKENK